MVLSAKVIAQLEKLDPFTTGGGFTGDVLVIPREVSSNDASFVSKLTAIGAAVDRQAVGGYSDVMIDSHQSAVPGAVIDATIAWLAHRSARPATERLPGVGKTDARTAWTLPSSVRSSKASLAHEQIIETSLRFGDQGALFGILSRPPGPGRRTGIVLANAGAVYRVGPNGIYTAAAREWASLGYTVLRMDIGGLGDSQTPAEGVENHTYPSHAVADIAAGVDALRSQGVERVVVAGLCSGAHASFHAGLGLSGLAGIMVINPIVFHWKPSDPLDVAAWVNYEDVRYYSVAWRRLQSWKRLVTGQVNVLSIAHVAAVRLREIAHAKGAALLRRVRRDTKATEDVAAELARIRAAGAEVFLLFSQGDPGEDFLMLNHGREVRRLQKQQGFAMQSIDNADHTFSMVDSRRRALAALTGHLLTRHP